MRNLKLQKTIEELERNLAELDRELKAGHSKQLWLEREMKMVKKSLEHFKAELNKTTEERLQEIEEEEYNFFYLNGNDVARVLQKQFTEAERAKILEHYTNDDILRIVGSKLDIDEVEAIENTIRKYLLS